MTNDNRQSTIIQPTVVSPARTNPTQLLLRNPSTTKENTTTNIHNNHQQSEVLDSSVIDKHLDNIRLKKLNNELQTKIPSSLIRSIVRMKRLYNNRKRWNT